MMLLAVARGMAPVAGRLWQKSFVLNVPITYGCELSAHPLTLHTMKHSKVTASPR